MSIILPEIEIINRAEQSVLYLEHGWPTDLCRWHAHEEYELHLILETSGKAFVGDYIGPFEPGALFLTGPNLPHNWVTDKSHVDEVDVRDMLVQFDDKSLQQMMAAFPEFREVQNLLEMSRSGVEFIGFDPEIAADYLARLRDQRGSVRVLTFLDFLFKINAHADKKTLSVVKISQVHGNQKQIRIGQVVDYVAKNYADNMSVADATAMAGMSEASFTRNFQANTGNRLSNSSIAFASATPVCCCLKPRSRYRVFAMMSVFRTWPISIVIFWR